MLWLEELREGSLKLCPLAFSPSSHPLRLHPHVLQKYLWDQSPPRSLPASDSATPQLQPARLLCPWDSPGKNTGVGCHFLLQGIFPASQPRNRTSSPAMAGTFFTTEPPGKPLPDH